MTKAKDDDHANDNRPFDEKEWRREYMKAYMRKKRERLKAAKLQGGRDA